MINVEAVSVYYGHTIALDELTLEIGPGVTGVFGPNGSGKSTLLRLATGLLRPSRGEVKVGGVRVDLGNESFRRSIGYAGHETGLYARLTVLENLELFGKLYGVQGGRALSLLEQLGIADRAGVKVGDLSAGLKRRVAVARAMLHEPHVLILDEPYANLDDEAADLVSETIRRGWSSEDRFGILATHGAKRVKEFANATLVLKRGRAVSYRKRVPQEVS